MTTEYSQYAPFPNLGAFFLSVASAASGVVVSVGVVVFVADALRGSFGLCQGFFLLFGFGCLPLPFVFRSFRTCNTHDKCPLVFSLSHSVVVNFRVGLVTSTPSI